jgi:hypothetical protein
VTTASWPLKLGLLAATAAGIAMALGLEQWAQRRSPGRVQGGP